MLPGQLAMMVRRPPVAALAATPQVTSHSGATSYTQSFAVLGRPSRKLVVFFSRSGDHTISNVRWGGSGGVPLINRITFTSEISMWELFNPAVGTQNIYFEMSTTGAVNLCAMQVINTRNEATTTAATGEGGSAETSNTETLSVAARSLALDYLMITNSSSVAALHGSSVGAQVRNGVVGSQVVCMSTYNPPPAPAAPNVTLGWSWTASAYRHVMTRFRPEY